VSAKASVVIVEGVGAARQELTHLLDAAVWMQSDFGEAKWTVPEIAGPVKRP
jgi:hypothetical protein